MKPIYITILLLLGLAKGLNAQTTIVLKGQINNNTTGQKVFIAFTSSNCSLNDTAYTDNLGRYTRTIVIGSGCKFGPIRIKMLNCKNDTLIEVDTFNSSTTNPDTMVHNFRWCDTCAYVVANFRDSMITYPTINFTNMSSGASSYSWNFGDTTTSSSANPSHTYGSPGTRTVCLIATDTKNGCADTICKNVVVHPCRYFKNNVYYSASGLFCNFYHGNLGGANKFKWHFGDGNTSTSANPAYTYATSGTYNVCVTTKDSVYGCSDSSCIKITAIASCKSFAANFTFIKTGLTVSFTNTSASNASKYNWKFGTSGTSTAKNPTFTFASPGTYTVCLTARDSIAGCVDSICKTITVISCATFNANFTSSGTGLSKAFFNSSSSNANKFNWNFGDGGTSTANNPSHTYATAGIYSVCLVARDTVNNCIDTTCNFVIVNPCSGFGVTTFTSSGSGLIKTFTSAVTGKPTHFKWYFGDATSSTAANPSHAYASSGSYTVCLVVKDSVNGCNDSICKTITVCGSFAGFTLSKSSLLIALTNTSTIPGGGTNIYNWDFGDANTSTTANPTHTYSTPGTYTVCLDVTSTIGCTDKICKTITVEDCNSFSGKFTFTDSCQAVKFAGSSSGSSVLYIWDFGDGGSAGGANPNHNYAAVGSYNVCLFALDTAGGCMDTICQTVELSPSLRGTVFRDSGNFADSGIVYLIKVTIDTVANDTILAAVDSAYFFNGAYDFGPVPAGTYLVKAALLPGSAFYTNRIPAYHTTNTGYATGAAQWRNATYFVVSQACEYAAIGLITGTNPGGSGFIGGYVSVGANKTGDPLEKIQVNLYHTNNTPFGYTYTNASGQYQFNNVAFGSYKVMVEIPGKPCEEYLVTLSQANPSATTVDFEVNTKNITLKKTNTGIAQVDNGKLALYPNPAGNVVNLGFESPVTGPAIITITDLAGKQVKLAKYDVTDGNNLITLDINLLDYGFYLVTVHTANTVYTGKLSINK